MRKNETQGDLGDVNSKFFYLLQGFPRPLSNKYLYNPSLEIILNFVVSLLKQFSNRIIVVYFSSIFFSNNSQELSNWLSVTSLLS